MKLQSQTHMECNTNTYIFMLHKNILKSSERNGFHLARSFIFCCNPASRHSSICLNYVLPRKIDSPNLEDISCRICLSRDNSELHRSAFFHPITNSSCRILLSCDHLPHSVPTGRRQNYSTLTWLSITELVLSWGLALELFNKSTCTNFLYQIVLLLLSWICDIRLSRNLGKNLQK
jgi:hypothetical protein